MATVKVVHCFLLLLLLLVNLVTGIRLNCGGPAIDNYLADSTKYNGATTSRVNAFPSSSTGGSIINTHAWVHRTDLVYTFKLQPGLSVSVSAHFAENYRGAASIGARRLRVSFGNTVVGDDVDVFAQVGFLKIFTIKRTVVVPSNGMLTVSVRGVVQNPMISGIDIVDPVTGADVPEGTGPQPSIPPTTTPSPTPSPQTPSQTPPPLQGSGAWRTVQLNGGPEPSKRHEACAVMVNGKVVLIGGRGRRPTSVFDPKTRRWTNKSVPPVELNHMQCVAWKERFVYVVGAWFGPFPREKAHEVTYIYDAQTDKWDTVPGLPASRRRGGGALVIYKNKLVLGMGNVGGHGAHATSVGWTDEFDLVKQDGWKRLADAPDPRDHVGGGVVGGKYFCIGGGRDGGVANFWGTPVTRVNCLNFDTGVWERRANMPDGRAGASTGATCQGLLMIAGGEGRAAGTTSGGKAYDRVDLYDVLNDQFKPPVFLKRGRHGSGLAVADCNCGNIYLPSGSGGLGGGPELPSTEVWSPDGVVRNC